MIHQQINIGGKLRPVRFSFAALYEYEKNTGRNALSDFATIQASGVSVTLAADLIYSGLALGAKTIGREPDFTPYDVADWAFSEPGAVEKAMELFSDSFPQNKPDTEDGGGESKKSKKKETGGIT